MVKPQQFVVLAGVTFVALVWAAILFSTSNQRSAGGVEGWVAEDAVFGGDPLLALGERRD